MRSDGSRFPAELAISQVDAPGAPLFTACLRDVTDRKMGEEALRSAEVRYRTLVEQLPLATYIDRVDPSSSNIYSSPQLESMLGYSADEWVSDPLLLSNSSIPTIGSAYSQRTRGCMRRRRLSTSSIA